MKDILISIILFLYVYFLMTNYKEKTAILIMIFMIPFFLNPFYNSRINSGIHVQTSGLLVFGIWFLMKFNSRTKKIYKIDWKQLSPKVNSLYYFLFMGIILGIIFSDSGIEYFGVSRYTGLTPLRQIINNSIYLILVILMLKILVNFQYDNQLRAKIAKLFIVTIFIQVLSQVLMLLKMEDILLGLFKGTALLEIQDIRNLGLYNGFGMGVYVVLIVSFSLLYYKKHKSLSVMGVLFAMIYSLLSGQRQTLVFIFLFFMALILIYILKGKIPLVYILSLIFISILLLIFWNNYISEIIIFKRITIAISYLQKGEIIHASNRDYAEIPYVMAELKNYPILGKGLLNLGLTKNSITNVAAHVIWVNIYKKFGIIGLIYLLTIIIYPITKLYKIIMKTNDRYVIKEGAILFSLMVIVFVQQFFDNFFWFSNTMLLYAFIYFWVFSFFNRQKLGNNIEIKK